MEERIYLYTRFERFWHWTQAVLIILLMITGFEVHGTIDWLGFEKAVDWHNLLAYALLVLTAFAIFWHFTTGEWKQYTPTLEKAGEVFCYYTRDIFQGKQHPIKKSRERKLNPLQRITYFLLKVFLFPFQMFTGLMYLFYHDLPRLGLNISLETIGLLHTAGAFAFLVFLVLHIYLATTGYTVWSHLKAMLTGWEVIEVK